MKRRSFLGGLISLPLFKKKDPPKPTTPVVSEGTAEEAFVVSGRPNWSTVLCNECNHHLEYVSQTRTFGNGDSFDVHPVHSISMICMNPRCSTGKYERSYLGIEPK